LRAPRERLRPDLRASLVNGRRRRAGAATVVTARARLIAGILIKLYQPAFYSNDPRVFIVLVSKFTLVILKITQPI
jgi:hypothetical protein